jgi:hypothetical protein
LAPCVSVTKNISDRIRELEPGDYMSDRRSTVITKI